jgi:hypothetical protein
MAPRCTFTKASLVACCSMPIPQVSACSPIGELLHCPWCNRAEFYGLMATTPTWTHVHCFAANTACPLTHSMAACGGATCLLPALSRQPRMLRPMNCCPTSIVKQEASSSQLEDAFARRPQAINGPMFHRCAPWHVTLSRESWRTGPARAICILGFCQHATACSVALTSLFITTVETRSLAGATLT